MIAPPTSIRVCVAVLILPTLAFGAFDTELGPALAGHGGARFHLAGRLELNHWNGRVTPQLRLEDAAPA